MKKLFKFLGTIAAIGAAIYAISLIFTKKKTKLDDAVLDKILELDDED